MHFGYFSIGLGLVAVLVIITSIAMFPDICSGLYLFIGMTGLPPR